MDLDVRNLIDPAVEIDLRANNLSRLSLPLPGEPSVLTRVIIPGGSVVRVDGHEVNIPLGEERVVRCRTGDYELVTA